ncbi:MAG: type 4a pilus biogenesis protein PilO, partial [Burkholderiales bacterium]
MANVLDQFKNLNTRDPGGWPPLPKLLLLVGILVGVLGIAYFIDWQGQLEELEAGRRQEETLKQAYVD